MENAEEKLLVGNKEKKLTYELNGMDMLSLFVAMSTLVGMGLYGMWYYEETDSRILKEKVELFIVMVCVIFISFVYQITVYCLYVIWRGHQQLLKALVMICSCFLSRNEYDLKLIEPRLFKALHTRRILIVTILDVIGVAVSFALTVFPDLYLMLFVYLFWEMATLTLESCCLNLRTDKSDKSDDKLTLMQEFRSQEYGKIE